MICDCICLFINESVKIKEEYKNNASSNLSRKNFIPLLFMHYIFFYSLIKSKDIIILNID